MTAEGQREVDLASTVAARARGLLAERRMKQKELGFAMGMSLTAINGRLNDSKDFDLNELPALARALGTSIEYLLGLTEERGSSTLTPRYLAVVGAPQASEVVDETPSRMADVLTFRRPRASRRWNLGRSA